MGGTKERVASGHQLHFDSDDEGRGASGPRHPLVSTVLYLSKADVGGPTLVTRQVRTDSEMRLSGPAALVAPRENRVLAFDGQLLHAVVPGRGPSRSPTARRVTLMIAFWDKLANVHAFHADQYTLASNTNRVSAFFL